MNIFYVDKNPTIAGRSLCDKHTVRMVLESAQLLCTAHHMCQKHKLPTKFYRKTHYNHPSAIWVRESSHNYKWLCTHALALCDEYTYRYNKTHASLKIIEWCFDHIPNVPNNGPTPVRLAMPKEYHTDCAVESYRKYYWFDKRLNIDCSWKKCRAQPYWFSESYFNDYNS